MMGWFAAMPFDVPKTNVQASWESKVVGSYFPELFRIARERGPLALYTGLIPTIARAFPANAALFLGVEMTTQGFFRFVFVDGRTDDIISGETTTHQLYVVSLRGRQRHGGEFQCS